MLIICSILNRLKEKNTTCCLELATMFKLTSENVSLNINGCCMLLKLFYKLYHNESPCFLWKEYKCRMLGLNIPNELISKQKKNIFKLNCTETICRLQLLTTQLKNAGPMASILSDPVTQKEYEEFKLHSLLSCSWSATWSMVATKVV